MSEALKKMREKFPDNQVGKLAKGSKAQTQCKPEEKTSCKICGGWHHPKMIHLDYVGHAALTDRLLDSDIRWSWEPLAFDANGIPAFDSDGGLWIKLTIDGVTRLGYGNAELSEYKEIGARQKEVIGDALRNAAMRFGAALELWHKGILHAGEEFPEGENTAQIHPKTKSVPAEIWDKIPEAMQRKLQGVADEVRAAMEYSNMDEALRLLSEISDPEEKTALWSRLDSKERSAIKAASKKE